MTLPKALGYIYIQMDLIMKENGNKTRRRAKAKNCGHLVNLTKVGIKITKKMGTAFSVYQTERSMKVIGQRI